MLTLDNLECSDATSNVDAYSFRWFLGHGKICLFYRHVSSGYRELDKAAGLLHIFAVNEGFWNKTFDFSSDLAREQRCIEQRDRSDARLSCKDRGPCLFCANPDGTHQTNSRYYHSALCHMEITLSPSIC